jgi:hypothetical protein
MRLSSLHHFVLAGASVVLASACVLDWDKLDPDGASGVAGSGAGFGGNGACAAGETVPCYNGPTGTENVGVCTGGITTCVEDGSGFGPCVGEVLPLAEDCNTASDDNCNGVSNETEAGCMCTPGTLASCYEGPAGTQNVGSCVGGQRLCLADGATQGICIGQVLPRIEECGTPQDDDCDGDVNSGCPLWAARFGQGGDQYPWGMVVLADGSAIVAGQSNGSVNFGGGALVTPAGDGLDAIIAKLGPNGAHIASLRFGGAGDAWIDEVAVDAAGDVYVVATFGQTFALGGAVNTLTASGTLNAAIAKLDGTSLAPIWALQLGVSGSTHGLGIDVDSAGNVVAVGYYSGTIDVGAGSDASQGDDGWLVRVSPLGALVSGLTFGGAGDDHAWDVALDGTSAVVVVGDYDEALDFGMGSLPDASSTDGFIVKLDSANTQLWIKQVGDAGDQSVNHVSVRGADVVVAGDATTGIDFDGYVASAVSRDVFIITLDQDGNTAWTTLWSGPGAQESGGVAMTPSGAIWFGVSHELSVDYGGGDLVSFGSDDWALVKLDAAGQHVRSHRFGGPADQDPRELASDAQGNLYVAGDCEGSIDFGAGFNFDSGSGEDICLAVLPASP